MFSATVEGGFSAQHQVRLPDGTLEPLHGHEWRIRVRIDAPALDPRDMVVDFAAAQAALHEAVADFHHADLNRLDAFAGVNPTAERVAERIFRRLLRAGLRRVTRVEVTEAPGCTGAYGPDANEAPQLEPGRPD
jgi:6-pyruvoyltetrahydropterin/6-carboxytetrahydropterin synthase